MSEVKKQGPTMYGMEDSREYVTEWALEIELLESIVYNLPVIKEGWRYLEYTDADGIVGAFGIKRHGAALLETCEAGLPEVQRSALIYRQQFGEHGELERYKIRVLSVFEYTSGKRDLIKSGVWYQGDDPRAFFKFFLVSEADITALLEAE